MIQNISISRTNIFIFEKRSRFVVTIELMFTFNPEVMPLILRNFSGIVNPPYYS